MEKEREIFNGSYFYKLNEELSGTQSITPYFVEAGTADSALEMGDVREGELTGAAGEEQGNLQ